MRTSSLQAFCAGFLALLVALPYSKANGNGTRNPFYPGTLELDTFLITPSKDGSPLYSTVYHPKTNGTYIPIFFLGGAYDYVSTDWYSSFLGEVTKHGYIVIGIDRFHVPSPPQRRSLAKRQARADLLFHPEHGNQTLSIMAEYGNFKKQMDWLRANLANKTGSVIPDWSKLTYICHSASCDTTLKFVQQYPSYTAASVFLDPVSLAAKKLTPVPSDTVSLSYVSERSFNFPNCCIKGLGFKRFYDLMTSLKVRMSVRDFGHCDILDEVEWVACYVLHICPCGEKNRVADYRLFTAGMIHAFLSWTLHGDTAMSKYVLDQNNMPLPIDNYAYSAGFE